MLASLFLILLPFCQTGINYYASISTLLTLCVVLLYRSAILRGIVRSPWVWPTAALMFLPAVFYGVDLLQELLRAGREALFLIILVGAIRGSGIERPLPIGRLASSLLFGIVMALFLMTAAQAVLYSRGTYFGLPKDVYIMGTGTITDEKALISSAGNLRPSATYSEPSYLGLILLSLAMMVAPIATTPRGRVMMGVIVVTGLLSRSASFLLTGALLLIVPAVLQRRRGGGNIRMVLLALMIAVPVLLFTKAGMLFDRLSKASTTPTADFSAQMRLVGPMRAMPGYLSNYPIGLPADQMLKVLPNYYPSEILDKGFSSDNAFLNFFFLYGFLAIALLATIFMSGGDLRINLFLFSCMMFNGGFLRVDMTGVMIFAIMNYLSRPLDPAKRLLRRTGSRPVRGRLERPLVIERTP